MFTKEVTIDINSTIIVLTDDIFNPWMTYTLFQTLPSIPRCSRDNDNKNSEYKGELADYVELIVADCTGQVIIFVDPNLPQCCHLSGGSCWTPLGIVHFVHILCNPSL
jgi:hypothetical protein